MQSTQYAVPHEWHGYGELLTLATKALVSKKPSAISRSGLRQRAQPLESAGAEYDIGAYVEADAEAVGAAADAPGVKVEYEMVSAPSSRL